jgi:hypothetical protein
MVDIIEIVPMKLLFVAIFSLLPIILTVSQSGYRNISLISWVSFALVFLGVFFTYITANSVTTIKMQRYLWPLLAVSALGLLLYRHKLKTQDQFDEQSVERGGTDYE